MASTIVHLGGQAIEADWETVLRANTSAAAICSRRRGAEASGVVFASTNHVMGFYPRTTRIDDRAPPT